MLPLPPSFEEPAHLTVLSDGRVLASNRDGDECQFALLDPSVGKWVGPVTVPHWLNLGQAAVLSTKHVLVAGSPAVVVSVDPLRVEPVQPSLQDWLNISIALHPDGVLVAGGFRVPSVPNSEAKIYRTGQWSSLATMPSPRWDGWGVQSRGGRIVLGGRTPVAADKFSVDVYDPTQNAWTRTRPDWSAPELSASDLVEMREIHSRHHGYVPELTPDPTTAMWTSPVATADGNVVLFLDAMGEFGTSLQTMAWLDPVGLAWGAPVQIPDYIAQVNRPVVGLADGRLVTTGWSLSASAQRLFTWSRTEGWREVPKLTPRNRTPLARLPDDRILFVAQGSQSLILDWV
jgi:hypothetical protein